MALASDLLPRLVLNGLVSPYHVQVVVQHVHFDGLGRTKDDIIMYEIRDVFKAKNLIEASIPLCVAFFPSLLETPWTSARTTGYPAPTDELASSREGG